MTTINKKNSRTTQITVDELFLAARAGDLLQVKKWWKQEGDFNIVYTNYETPLIVACQANKAEVVKFLLDKGADINESTQNGQTPVMVCLTNDSFQSLEVLVNKGADLNVINHDGTTALMMALEWDLYVTALNFFHAGAKAFPLYDKMNKNQPIFSLVDRVQWHMDVLEEDSIAIKNLYWGIINQEKEKLESKEFIQLLKKIIEHNCDSQTESKNFIVEAARVELEKIQIEMAVGEKMAKDTKTNKNGKITNKRFIHKI